MSDIINRMELELDCIDNVVCSLRMHGPANFVGLPLVCVRTFMSLASRKKMYNALHCIAFASGGDGSHRITKRTLFCFSLF